MSHSLAAMLYVPGSDERKLAKIGSSTRPPTSSTSRMRSRRRPRRRPAVVAAALARGSSTAALWVRVNPGASRAPGR